MEFIYHYSLKMHFVRVGIPHKGDWRSSHECHSFIWYLQNHAVYFTFEAVHQPAVNCKRIDKTEVQIGDEWNVCLVLVGHQNLKTSGMELDQKCWWMYILHNLYKLGGCTCEFTAQSKWWKSKFLQNHISGNFTFLYDSGYSIYFPLPYAEQNRLEMRSPMWQPCHL